MNIQKQVSDTLLDQYEYSKTGIRYPCQVSLVRRQVSLFSGQAPGACPIVFHYIVKKGPFYIVALPSILDQYEYSYDKSVEQRRNNQYTCAYGQYI